MNLGNFWSRLNAPPVPYTDDAVALFSRFASRHGLFYETIDAPVEVMWKFPVQEKLLVHVTLGLQNNDELNFGVPGFWSYFFPFPHVAGNFEKYIDAWVAGTARIVRHPGRFTLTSVSALEVLIEGNWVSVYRAGGESWEHPSLVIQNVTGAASAC